MAPNDLGALTGFIIGLVGEVLDEIGIMLASLGATFSGYASDPLVVGALNLGIFGENGGLIYWLNEKVLWLIGELFNSITFTYTPEGQAAQV